MTLQELLRQGATAQWITSTSSLSRTTSDLGPRQTHSTTSNETLASTFFRNV